jgi:putative restriction endonuclease
MPVTFNNIELEGLYSRRELARLWGYVAYQAISRGVVTPRGDNKIILFVTAEKQAQAHPYDDFYANGFLKWEGPTDHFAEQRIINSRFSEDEIHLFYRQRHHLDFIYAGKIIVLDYVLKSSQPSVFNFKVGP